MLNSVCPKVLCSFSPLIIFLLFQENQCSRFLWNLKILMSLRFHLCLLRSRFTTSSPVFRFYFCFWCVAVNLGLISVHISTLEILWIPHNHILTVKPHTIIGLSFCSNVFWQMGTNLTNTTFLYPIYFVKIELLVQKNAQFYTLWFC